MSVNVLNISNNSYKDWLTYEAEYINEAFSENNNVSILKWGCYRDGLSQSKHYKKSIDKSIDFYFNNSDIDILIVALNDIFTLNIDNSLLFNWIKTNRKRFKFFIRVNDPWRFVEKIDTVVKELNPNFIFLPSIHSKKVFSGKYANFKTKFHVLPYCIGRRYFNLGIDREYDLSMIGRCQINGKDVSPYIFSSFYKVYSENSLSKVRNSMNKKKYFSRIMNTVVNLNKSKSNFNSPVIPKGSSGIYHVPFRYLETAVCGSISLSTMSFNELNELYFPRHTYIDCNNSLLNMMKHINSIKKHPEDYAEMQSIAYKYAILNHQAKNRTDFIIDLANDVKNIEARDYYNFSD